MINERFDIAHVTVAVPDLELVMEHFATTLGVEWGPILDIGPLDVSLYDADGREISEGLREVWTVKRAVDESGPSLELSCSAPGSASQGVWGVPSGVHRFHHICYYVDDLVVETAHLVANGFVREVSVSPPELPPEFMAYVVSPFGIRYELMQSRDKPAMARWLRTGELTFES